MNNKCKICGSKTSKIFHVLVLKKYITDYFQCDHCEFIQTEEPHWLNEAYATAMTALDVGLVYRNISFSHIIPSILDLFSTNKDSYIDYGGGYGMFVRIMRDKGYDFYLQDMYAENIFAKHFEIKDYKRKEKFAALTTFEVFEHLVNPIEEINKMFDLSDTIVFSTELQPSSSIKDPSDWWYFIPETGQHISLYSKKSLEVLSKIFKKNLYTNGNNLHILTSLNLKKDPFLIENNSGSGNQGLLETLLSKVLNRLKRNQELNSRQKEDEIKRNSLMPHDSELYRTYLNKPS